MKFMAVCGSGLGSSFMVQMNIEKILKELGVSGIEVQHSDISSASSNDADVFFLARDVAERVEDSRGAGRLDPGEVRGHGSGRRFSLPSARQA